MPDGRPVSLESVGDIALRYLQDDMADIHGDLAHMAFGASPITKKRYPVCGKMHRFGRQILHEAAGQPRRHLTRAALPALHCSNLPCRQRGRLEMMDRPG